MKESYLPKWHRELAIFRRVTLCITDGPVDLLPAHVAGSLKGKVTVRTTAEVQRDPLRPEHGLCFFLPFELTL